MIVTCNNCSKEFDKVPDQCLKTNNHYCSRKCANVKNSNNMILTPCNKSFSKTNTKGCHLVKQLKKDFKPTLQKTLTIQYSECPSLYFIKIIFLNDSEAIQYAKERLHKMIKNARKRSDQLYKRHGIIDVDINVDYIYNLWKEQNYRCAISNIPIIFGEDTFAYQLRASIDRKDNNLGYIKGNIQLVSLPINYAKNRQTDKTILNSLMILKNFI